MSAMYSKYATVFFGNGAIEELPDKIKGFNALVFDDNGLDRLERKEEAETQKFTAKKRELVGRYIDEIKSIHHPSAVHDMNITLL